MDCANIIGVCAIVTTVCVSLLVVSNLWQTKCVAKRVARKTTIRIIKKVMGNVRQLKGKDQPLAQDLYNLAIGVRDERLRLQYLEEAKKRCKDDNLKNKIEELIPIVEKEVTKSGNDFFDDLDALNQA